MRRETAAAPAPVEFQWKRFDGPAGNPRRPGCTCRHRGTEIPFAGEHPGWLNSENRGVRRRRPCNRENGCACLTVTADKVEIGDRYAFPCFLVPQQIDRPGGGVHATAINGGNDVACLQMCHRGGAFRNDAGNEGAAFPEIGGARFRGPCERRKFETRKSRIRAMLCGGPHRDDFCRDDGEQKEERDDEELRSSLTARPHHARARRIAVATSCARRWPCSSSPAIAPSKSSADFSCESLNFPSSRSKRRTKPSMTSNCFSYRSGATLAVVQGCLDWSFASSWADRSSSSDLNRGLSRRVARPRPSIAM